MRVGSNSCVARAQVVEVKQVVWLVAVEAARRQGLEACGRGHGATAAARRPCGMLRCSSASAPRA